MKAIPRNNTDFPIRLLEFYRTQKWDEKWDFLKYWQNILRIYMSMDTGARGLLINVSMGLGKSLAAVAIAMEFVESRDIIMLMAKSIQPNMDEAIRKYVKLRAEKDAEWPIGKLDAAGLTQWIREHFSFVSMNASNMLGQLNEASSDELSSKLGKIIEETNLDGKLIIVDEAHNLFRAITHGSKNAVGFYDLCMKAKGANFAFLTGTPIANDPFELVPAFNILSGELLFPEDYEEFTSTYLKPENRGRFQNRIYGLVSYVDHSSRQGAGLGATPQASKVEFPTDLGATIVKTPMTQRQWLVYREAREKELAESTKPSGRKASARMSIPKSTRASTYRVRSRQYSNFVSPEGVSDPTGMECESPKFHAIYDTIEKNPSSLHIVYSQFKGFGGLLPMVRYFEARGAVLYNDAKLADSVEENEMTVNVKVGGWLESLDAFIARFGGASPLEELDDEEVREIRDSAELRRLGINLGRRQKLLACAGAYVVISADGNGWKVASQTSGGIGMQKIMREVAKMQGDKTGGAPITLAVISGDLSVEERGKIISQFTSPQNAHGDIITVLLITSTGAESLDLKNIRFVHILEPYWTFGRIQQVKYRGIRSNSHVDLPPEEKNVATFVYLAVPPSNEVSPEKTTDEEIYEDSIAAYAKITPFLEMLREVSIECSINAESWCRVCSPTSRPLYGNWVKDLSLPDPCREHSEKKIEASEITVDGVKYYYSKSSSVFDYTIYKLDTNLSKYIPLAENSEEFLKVYENIP